MYRVAPRAGAWIETLKKALINGMFTVAPRAGAWIETLKKALINGMFTVAPRAGAWIETLIMPKQSQNCCQSHPVRVRGLKRSFAESIAAIS